MDIKDLVSKLPKDTLAEMRNYKIAPEDVLLAAKSDLDENGKFQDRWIIATKKELLITDKAYYLIEDIESMKCEQMVSSGVMTAKFKDSEIIICGFTFSCFKSWAKFNDLFKKIKEDKELTEQDYMENTVPKNCPKCGSVYEDAERRICPKCFDKRSIFIRVLSYLPKYKFSLIVMILCMLASSSLNILLPYLGGTVLFDRVLAADGDLHGQILQLVLILFGVKLTAMFLGIIYGRTNSELTARVIYDLKTQVFEAMQKLSMNFFASKQTGSLMNRVHSDAIRLQYFFHDGAPYFVVNSITIVGIVVVMFRMSWLLALITLMPLPIVVFILMKIFPALYRFWDRVWRRNSTMNAVVNDSLSGVRVIKAFGKEKSEGERFTEKNEGVYAIQKSFDYFAHTAFGTVGFVMGSSVILVWAAGSLMVIRSEISFGTLMTFTGFIWTLLGPLEFMTQITQWWSNCMSSASRIFEITDAVPQVMEKEDPTPMPYIKGDISLTEVAFEYEPNKKVLTDVNLEVKSGEMIGLVGHSGAGKSTLTSIITRLYDVKEGVITIDGVNIKDIKLKDLHKQIGTVMQETYLFMGTMAENIAYAKPDATMDEIIEAAKIANAHQFIIKLPDGYETYVGSRGHNLSGGEKQRLAIARAVLMDPRILILDEATASLDTETEKLIQEALERLVKTRTTFAIAHRLSTLRNADRLVVLEKGKIEEVGTHEELFKKKGIYHKLITKQREALKLQGVENDEPDESEETVETNSEGEEAKTEINTENAESNENTTAAE